MKPLELVELEENQCKLNMPSNWPKNVKRSFLTRRWSHGDFTKRIWLWFMIVIMIWKVSKNCFQNGLGHISWWRYFLTTTYMNWFTLMERNVKKLIMTNLSIFIMVDLLFWEQNNKVSVGIDITPKWLLGVKVVTWKIMGRTSKRKGKYGNK